MSELSGHFGLKRLFRFTYPSIIMLVFTSIYGVADGFFISNYAGKTLFAAVNFIMPVLIILGCIGFMFGTGGGITGVCAIVVFLSGELLSAPLSALLYDRFVYLMIFKK